MSIHQSAISHGVETSTLADILERVLDKGVVIAGDIKIKLVDVELLTIQIRLLIASVDKAKEMGIDWWTWNPAFSSKAREVERQGEMDGLKQRIHELEARLAGEPPVAAT
jgi:hypothetical protein